MPGPVFLRGNTVTLRPVERDDLAFLQELINDPDVWPGFGAPDPRNRVAQEQRFEELIEQGDEIKLIICHEESSVGRIRLTHINEGWGTAELVCSVAPDEQNQGHATESSRLLVNHAFDSLRLNKLITRVFATNKPSKRVVEKLGFVREGTLRQHVYLNGEYIDMYYYGLLKSEWRSDSS
jgi:RimJ/RimL family protein N-acetyltransferase